VLEQKRTVQTNGAGHFAFLDLPAGKYTLVTGSGARAVTRDVIVSAEPQVVRIEIKLDHR
jgi:Fe2+ transport system protein B